MSTSLPIELASTIQSAHLNPSPDPARDINPSTAASQKEPVKIHRSSSSSSHSHSHPEFTVSPAPPPSKPARPLPDLRFEQSYLASLASCTSYYSVAYVTFRDQVFLPFAQGTVWTLLLLGWRSWNAGASFAGRGLGARIRRWWWGVNNWKVPERTERLEAIGRK